MQSGVAHGHDRPGVKQGPAAPPGRYRAVAAVAVSGGPTFRVGLADGPAPADCAGGLPRGPAQGARPGADLSPTWVASVRNVVGWLRFG